MASLTSSNWTIAFINERSQDTVITNRKKYVGVKLTLASGEWPAAGVALPAKGQVGLVRNLDTWTLNTPKLATASGHNVAFLLTTGSKIRALSGRLVSGTGRALLPLVTTVTMKSQIFYLTAAGW